MELLQDPRVCAFAEAWERERRAQIGLAELPHDAAGLRQLLTAATAELLAARAVDRMHSIRSARAAGTCAEEAAHLALGLAIARLGRAHDHVSMITMLFGAILEGKSATDVEP
jgi:hypothetical protein